MKRTDRHGGNSINPHRKWRTLVITVAVFLGGVLFVFSAVDKLTHKNEFYVQVGKSPILTGHEGITVWAVPIAEILVALLMVVPQTRQAGLYGFYTLMLAFTGYIVLLLGDAESPPCGCNALTERMSLGGHIVMNLAFSGLAATAIFLNRKGAVRAPQKQKK